MRTFYNKVLLEEICKNFTKSNFTKKWKKKHCKVHIKMFIFTFYKLLYALLLVKIKHFDEAKN